MAVETADDRLLMLTDFGIDVSYTLQGGSAVTYKAIVDNDYEGVQAGGTVAFASPSTAAQVSPSFNGETTSYTGEPGMLSLHWWTDEGVASHVQPIGECGRWVPEWAK